MTIKPLVKHSTSRNKSATINCYDKKDLEIKANIKYLFNKSSNIYETKLKKPTQDIRNIITTRTSSPKSTPAIYKTLSNDTFTLNNRRKVKKSILTLPKLESTVPICTKLNKHETHNKLKKSEKSLCRKPDVESNKSSTRLNSITKKSMKNGGTKGVKGNLGDVWTILKNIESFKVLPTPVISEASFTYTKKKFDSIKRTSDGKSVHKVDSEIKVIYSPESAASSSITAVVTNTRFRRKYFCQDKLSKKNNKIAKLDDIKDGLKLKSGGRQNIIPNNTNKENNKIKNRVQLAVSSLTEILSNKIKPKVSQGAKSDKEKHGYFTLTEIRKKVGLIKFPIIILGKDQLSSTVKVEKCPFPQFFGLTKHIWPFMRSWSMAVKNSEEIVKTSKSNIKNNSIKAPEVRLLDRNKSKQNNYFHINVKVERKDQTIKTQKNKPTINNKLINTDVKEAKRTELSVGDTKMIVAIGDQMHMKKKSKNEEFIDDIINKIKRGIYYNEIKTCKRRQSGKGNVKADQLTKRKLKEEDSKDSSLEFNKDLLLSIPGFDESLSDVFIEEISHKKVVVKNNRTQDFLEFVLDMFIGDNVPDYCQSTNSTPNIYNFPLHVSSEKLPESLCSILPTVLHNLSDLNTQNGSSIQKVLSQDYYMKPSNVDLKIKRRSKF